MSKKVSVAGEKVPANKYDIKKERKQFGRQQVKNHLEDKWHGKKPNSESGWEEMNRSARVFVDM